MLKFCVLFLVSAGGHRPAGRNRVHPRLPRGDPSTDWSKQPSHRHGIQIQRTRRIELIEWQCSTAASAAVAWSPSKASDGGS